MRQQLCYFASIQATLNSEIESMPTVVLILRKHSRIHNISLFLRNLLYSIYELYWFWDLLFSVRRLGIRFRVLLCGGWFSSIYFYMWLLVM